MLKGKVMLPRPYVNSAKVVESASTGQGTHSQIAHLISNVPGIGGFTNVYPLLTLDVVLIDLTSSSA
jgi:hypothetical protein